MTSTWWSVEVDCADHRAQARFWASVFDWQITFESDDEIAIAKDERSWPCMVFSNVPEGKIVKNRLHIDLHPDDQASEVARLESLGARPTDIGQGEVPWVVMADPEGNEFCVLTARAQS